MRERLWVRAVIVLLAVLLAMPPAVLAQMSGMGFPGGSGERPSAASAADPVYTAPGALQSTTPSYEPCPAPANEQRTPAPAPDMRDSGLELVGTGGSQSQGVSGDVAGRSRVPSDRPAAFADQANHSLPSSAFSSAITGTGQQAGASQAFAHDALTIEQSFERFFILQGVTERLRQFGYKFFDVRGPGMAPMMESPAGPGYRLGPNDTLALHVWDVPDPAWNRSFIVPVQRDGTVVIPRVGAIPIAGVNLAEAERIMHARLNRLIKQFEMHLSLARLRTITVYVVGEVRRPGAYEVSALSTVSQALYAACGPSKSGSLRRMQVVRNGKTVKELDFYHFLLNGDRTQDIQLRSGDTLLVPPVGPVTGISGPVRRPAIYELKGKTSLAELIDLAGGLLPTADREEVQILRVEPGRQRVILNLEMKKQYVSRVGQNGRRAMYLDKAAHFWIQDGDFVRIVSVPTKIENAVSLEGAVRNPGFYEFKSGMTISDLLTRDQMLVDSYWERGELVRTDPITYERTVIPFNPVKVLRGNETENRRLERLDKVIITTQARPPQAVKVAGEVKRPGTYPVEEGERLSSILKRAGGFTKKAFPQGIVFIRESLAKSQRDELQKFINHQREQLMSETANYVAGAPVQSNTSRSNISTDQQALGIQLQSLEEMSSRIRFGRVVIKMDSIEKLEGTPDDLILQNGDQITIPVEPETVTVMGAVRNPISMAYLDGVKADDYVQLAGGGAENAKPDDTYIVRANGTTVASYVSAQAIEPGDTIVVPSRIEPTTRALPLWQSVAQIAGSAALAVAGIAVIGR